MTNYKEIELYLKHGLHVGVKNKKEEYLTISPIKYADSYYRMSGRYDTLETAKQTLENSLSIQTSKKYAKTGLK